jgi:hypothetical protein
MIKKSIYKLIENKKFRYIVILFILLMVSSIGYIWAIVIISELDIESAVIYTMFSCFSVLIFILAAYCAFTGNELKLSFRTSYYSNQGNLSIGGGLLGFLTNVPWSIILAITENPQLFIVAILACSSNLIAIVSGAHYLKYIKEKYKQKHLENI